MTRNAPIGRATDVRALLLGQAPYGGSPQRDIYAALVGAYHSLLTGDRDELLRECGGSREWAAIVLSAFGTCADRLGRQGRYADDWFSTRLHTCWQEMRRLLDKRPGVEIEFARACGDDTLADLRDRLCIHLSRFALDEAIAALPGIIWQHARSSVLGEERLLYAAVGSGMCESEPWRRGMWHPGAEHLDVVATWAEIGQTALQGLPTKPLPRPAAPSRLQALAEASKPAAIPDGPSLLVLASVAHLPGSAKDGTSGSGPSGSTASNPRGEYAGIAGRRLPLQPVPDLAGVKGRMVAEFPDCERIIDIILAPLAARRFAWVNPILLRGAPGSGKSRLARRIGEELGLAVTVYGCAGVSDGAFIGTSRQWSTGRASVPMQAIKRANAASVLIVLDEISRAGTRQDNGRLTDGILGLTERETARAFHDPYLECATDLSACSYIATANDTMDLDPALLSRFRVLDMPEPTLASLPVLARSLVADLRRDRGLDERWLWDLTPAELDLVAEHWRGGSVRVLQALVECAVDGRNHGMAN